MGIDAIEEFRKSHGINTKGNLAGILQLNRAFSKDTLPINPDDYLTGKEGQVKGLSGANCQSILEEYHIKRVLASEGGRTSRGLMGIMKDYAALINEERPSSKDFSEIERFWIDRIRKFFNSKPFRLEADESLSITAAVGNLLEQAKKRQKENPGTMYEGTVLQQLVAAKLSIIMPEVEINRASVADDPTGRGGDFNIGDTAIHCTTAPATLLMEKCQRNIKNGLHPIIITVKDRVKTAWDLAADMGFAERLEVWDIQSFLSTNVHEHGHFSQDERKTMLTDLVTSYNKIIDTYETDPSLRIEYSN